MSECVFLVRNPVDQSVFAICDEATGSVHVFADRAEALKYSAHSAVLQHWPWQLVELSLIGPQVYSPQDASASV